MTKRVFVVDDERIIADSLATILNNSGYDASPFYDAESALLACELGKPDCLITDVVMPGRDGINLAIEVTNRVPACRVLLFSGQAYTSGLLATVQGRGLDFEVLPKPVHPRELLAKLEIGHRDSGRDKN
jgi:DNA-binding NtrC family response regulator